MKVLQVLNGHVLLRPRVAKTVAGIAIPDSVDKERPTVGEVVSGNTVKVGTTENGTICKLNESDIVLFNAFSPRKVEAEGEELLLVNGEDIYAVIQE